MSDLPTLWHFRVSHYNEKARWALDWKRLPHRRHAVLPGPHLPVIWWHTGQTQVPALRLGGVTIFDSTRIIAALEEHRPDPPLYPADAGTRARALALEDQCDEEIGPHLRRVFFHDTLEVPDIAIESLTVGESDRTRRLYGLAFPLVRSVLRRDLGLDDSRAAESRRRIERALARLGDAIGPTGYLVGDRFTVADLTAAALLAPLVRPPEFPYALPPLVPPLAAWRATLADSAAFRWVEDTYRRHRGVSCAVGDP